MSDAGHAPRAAAARAPDGLVRLRREAEAFALRFACDDCAHFDERRAACAHGYPASPRRDELAAEAFCKEFELG